MKRVAIGCSTVHDYSFFLPLVGLVWREVIEYEPTFFLVGSYGEWAKDRHGTIVPDALKHHNFHVEWVERMAGIEDATISQSVRLVAAAIQSFDPDDVLIPSDADLIPIKKEFYHRHDPDKYPIGLYYGNAYENEPRLHFPTCHPSMKVSTWRQLFQLDGGDIAKHLKAGFERRNLAERMKAKAADPKKNWGHVWFEDEFHLTDRVSNSQYWPEHVQIIRREGQPPKDRLDRSAWPAHYDPQDYTDCHSIRPGWSDSNWPRLQRLFSYLILDRMEWAEDYRIQFRKKMGCAG